MLDLSDAQERDEVSRLRERLRGGGLVRSADGADVSAAVREVIADVAKRDDQAVIDSTARIEGVELTPETMRVSPEELSDAHSRGDKEFLALVRRAAENVREYQQSIKLASPPALQRGGRELSVRYRPMDRVGIFVPGGSGSGAVLVSSMVMTVVPAQVAGVGEVAVVSPPTADGDISSQLLSAAAELGVTELYRVSGTAGLAALALGTERMAKVDKLAGPGNAYVTETKRQLFGRVGIDSLAGPSEVLIIADESAEPSWLAADLLSQAEHDPGSAVLVTPSNKLPEAVNSELDRQLADLPRAEGARKCLDAYSAIIITRDLDEACELSDSFAPEHLQVITGDDDAVLAKLRHGGAIFVGPHTPVPVGDYYAGPSHVLPTGSAARFSSPLSCNEFIKASSVLRYDADSLDADSADIAGFARREGLEAHARAVEVRRRSHP
ncbi:MAG: histidinol dehydrogenase [Phycisphaerae bacterium]